MSVPKLIRRIQVLFDDQQQDWCDKDYILNWLDLRNEDLEAKLQSLDLANEEEVLILPNVAALTADLSTYQDDGGVLQSLIIPRLIEWRRVGEGDQDWKEVRRKDKVVDTLTQDSSSIEAGVLSWEWRRRVVYISPSSIAVDLRVRGEFLPDALQSDSDHYIVGMTNVLAYMCAESIAVTRGEAKTTLATYFAKQLVEARDDLECLLIKQDQTVRRRLAGRRRLVPSFRLNFGSGGGGAEVTGRLRHAILQGVIDGVNKTFLVIPPPASGEPIVLKNGQTQDATSYSYLFGVVTFVAAPQPADAYGPADTLSAFVLLTA